MHASTVEYVPELQMVQVAGAGTSESSSAHHTSMLGGAMAGGSNIAHLLLMESSVFV